MKRHVPTCAALFVCLSALPSLSQHQHTAATTSVIDGHLHPELIPDAVAYRLWMITVAQPAAPSSEQAQRQNAVFESMQVPAQDRRALAVALTNFKSQYDSLVKSFNQEAKAAWANNYGTPNTAAFNLQRDQIVQSTITSLKFNLSPTGWTTLSTYVQSEKKKMKIANQTGASQ